MGEIIILDIRLVVSRSTLGCACVCGECLILGSCRKMHLFISASILQLKTEIIRRICNH